MTFDYEQLEDRLVEACNEVHKDFLKKFDADNFYTSPGGAKLEAFMTGLRQEFESAATAFLKKHGIHNNPEAKKRALTVTKLYAKRCVDDFSRI